VNYDNPRQYQILTGQIFDIYSSSFVIAWPSKFRCSTNFTSYEESTGSLVPG